MINVLLDKLQKVRSTGHNRWLACCPAHDDRSPSLAIKITEDERILMHCFGCGANGVEIIESVGMQISDLFPSKDKLDYKKKTKESASLPAQALLEILATEALIIQIAAFDILQGKIISTNDYDRIELASKRIQGALNYGK